MLTTKKQQRKQNEKLHTQQLQMGLLEYAVHYKQINLHITMFLRDLLQNLPSAQPGKTKL